MNKIKKIVYIFICLSLPLFANENKEVNIYTQYKYKAEYKKLSKEQQTKVKNEYKDLQKLSSKVKKKIDATTLYKIKDHLNILETWSLQFMKNYKVNEKELKTVYEKNDIKMNPRYKLKTLSLKDEKRAQSIIKQLKAKKTKEERIKLFNIFVKKDSIDINTKDKQGDLGWIDFANLIPNIKKSIVQLKQNDIMVLKINDNIQIVYIEDIKKLRKASFEESKVMLIKIAKEEALKKEIEKILK